MAADRVCTRRRRVRMVGVRMVGVHMVGVRMVGVRMSSHVQRRSKENAKLRPRLRRAIK